MSARLTISEVAPESPPQARPKKKLIRRLKSDRSQPLRRSLQIAFLILNVIIGVQFYFWVRYYETAEATRYVARPAGVEGWLPIAGLMNLKAAILTGRIPTIHPAGMFLIAVFLSISFLFRKAFCSWLCPVGTLSEYLWKLGRRIFRRNLALPRWLDLPLRGLKYLLLGFFLWAVGSMTSAEIASFLRSPYGLIADVKMLDFFRFLGTTGAIVIGTLLVLSVFIQNFWCRYLCPYGALLGLAALPSPLRIRRRPSACIDCARCARACPAFLPVDKLIAIRSAECTACLECVAVCPAQDALSLSALRRPFPAWALAAGIAMSFLGTVGVAKATGHWDSHIPRQIYLELVPHADQAQHPMPGH
ncbi:MAG TPA: 4Fe-4S binding protein [Terriglobales bacterium]|nr:4Fe-4S binding protein [Terriglobales bacterium]